MSSLSTDQKPARRAKRALSANSQPLAASDRRVAPLLPTTIRSKADREATAWLESFNPLRGLSIRRAQMLFDAARRGNDARLQWIYENIEQSDPTLMICAERRASAIVQLDWTIHPKAATRVRGFDETLASEQCALLEAAYGQAEEANLFPAIEHLSKAFFRGHAHIRPLWSPDGTSLCGFECLNAWNLCRDLVSGQWYWNPKASDTLDFASLQAVPPGELCTLVRTRHIDYPAMAIYLRNGLGEKAWGRFLERYGIPPVIITMPQDVDPAQVDLYCERAARVADGGSGALPFGSTVSYATEARGTNPFKEFLEHQQQLVVLMATGGMLTSLTGATGIGQGATGAHEETWRTIVRRDAVAITTILNRTVSDALLDRAFPGKPHLAAFDFETEPKPSPAEVFDLATKAVQAGYQLDKAELEERTGYRLIEKAPSADYGWPVRAVGNTRSEPALIRQPSSVIRERSERELRALARSLQLDFGPAAEALETFLAAPCESEARALIARLPELLPGDPQSAIILEQALAEAYTTEAGKTVVENSEGDAPAVANSAERCPDCGQWLNADGTCTECRGADEAAAKGQNPDPVKVQTAEIGKGKAALKKCLEEQTDAYDAIARGDLGTISFIYGDERRGIAHFMHRKEALKHLPETIIRGKSSGPYEGGRKCNLTYGDYTAVLRLQHDGKEDRWVVTAFRPQDQKEEGSPR